MGDKTHRAVAVGPGRTCPVCRKGELQRSRRKAWMSRVPFSKYYVCSKCGAGFLRLLDTVQLRMPGGTGGLIGDEFSRDAKKKFVLVSSAIAGLVYACYQLVISLYESVLP